tara:strand:- start:317 stop:778 length:462 start_codon:yes stop_codon:yes gene_type:complete
MATPVTGNRGDIVVQVELDPASLPGVFTNLCGVTSASFSVNNEVISFKVGDCDDWSEAVQTVKNYGALDASISISTTWTADQHPHMLKWVLEQKKLNTRLAYPNATTGQVSSIDCVGLMEGLELADIGNVDGNPQTEDLTIQCSGGITPTYAT